MLATDFMPHAESFGSHTTILAWYEIAVWLAFVAWIVNYAVGWGLVRRMPAVIRTWIRPGIQLLGLYGAVSIFRTCLNGLVLRYPFYGLQAVIFFIDAHVVIGLATVGIWYTVHPESNIFTRMALHKRDSDRFRSIIESAKITGLVEIDENKMIWFVSQRAYQLFGYQRDELRGKDMSQLIASRFWMQDEQAIDDFLLHGKNNLIDSSLPVTVKGLKKNGGEFDLEICFSSYVYGNAYHFVFAVRDVSYRVDLEAQRDA